MTASYGMEKLSFEDTYRILCKQRLGSISCYDFSGSIEKVINFLNQEKEYYKEYLDGCELLDIYLESPHKETKKFVKFSEIIIEYNCYGEFGEFFSQYLVYGLRDLDEAEKSFREKEKEALEAKRQKEKREQYEKLKKEFENDEKVDILNNFLADQSKSLETE